MDSESPTAIGWAGSALVLTAVLGMAGKIASVIVAPGARGVLGESTINFIDTTSGAFAYTLAALLVALVCGASFELARARSVNVIARGGAVAISGLIVALASPAVIERLGAAPSLALAVVTSALALIASVVVVRNPRTRALGAVLALFAICGLFRVVAWETSAAAFERASSAMLEAARGFATVAAALQALATLFAAAWIGTRSRWRGRILVNAAILLAFAITWLAARNTDSPSATEAIVRGSLLMAAGTPPPYLLGSIAAFVMPASILLAGAALLQTKQPQALVASLALALLSSGGFDVPMHALLVTASAQWAMLATADHHARGERGMSSVDALSPQTRGGAAPPASSRTESA